MKIQVKPSIKKIGGRTYKRWVVRAIADNGEVVNSSEVLNSKKAVYKNILAAVKIFDAIARKKVLIQYPKEW
jgi:hypothetical protein